MSGAWWNKELNMKRMNWRVMGGVVGLVMALCVVVGVSGCGKGEKGAGGSGSGKKDASGNEVLSHGDEPRVALRWSAKAGDVWRMVMTMDISTEQEIGAEKQPNSMKLPVMECVMDLGVESVDAEGQMAAVYTLSEINAKKKPGVSPLILGAMQQTYQTMRGMRASMRMSAIGKTEMSSWVVPEGIDPNVATMMDQAMKNTSQMTPVFPVDPVGVGAKWRSSGPFTSAGMTIDQTFEYTVLSIDASGNGELGVTVTQSAKAQDVALPGVSAEQMKMRLQSMSGTSSGTIKLVRGMPMASEFVMTGTAQQKIQMGFGGGEMTDVDQTVSLEVKAKTERKKEGKGG